MGKAGAFLLILLTGFTFLLYAQDENPGIEEDWDIIAPDTYVAGDQTFLIALGTVFPAVFLNNGEIITHNIEPPVGGALMLSYNYHLGVHFYLGGEINFNFLPTLGQNMLYLIPLGLRIGYQLYLWRFEFPINLTVGMAWHRYMDIGYYGLYLKFGGSVYYRFNSDWSFGLTTNWGWFPEWTEDPKKNVDGNIIDLILAARYHF